MGWSLGSEYKRGFKCYKCGKRLMYYRKIKGHYKFDNAHAYICLAREFVRLIIDPSEGKTTGWHYGYMCKECWKKDKEKR